MRYFEFDNSLITGIKSIDEQHKYLFSIFDDLMNALSIGSAKNIIYDLLMKLKDYALYHFNDEENLMISINYPDIDFHMEEHNNFKKIVEQYINEYKDTNYSITADTTDFLYSWIRHHILISDKKIVEYLSNKKI
ncbi:MAG: hemerythrin family protein [Spirochaetales bacterium]|nr:hemerythrin family protein [Spirochaetales bacterium]